MTPFRHSLRVRFNECDPQGIVFNANYLVYGDIAITELYREAFGSWQAAMDEHGIDMVVAEATVRYRAPLRFDEPCDLLVRVTRIGETSTTTLVTIERASEAGARAPGPAAAGGEASSHGDGVVDRSAAGETVAEVETRHVVVDPLTRAKAPIPAAMRRALQAYG